MQKKGMTLAAEIVSNNVIHNSLIYVYARKQRLKIKIKSNFFVVVVELSSMVEPYNVS